MQLVRERLDHADTKMEQAYMRRKGLSAQDLRASLKPADLVLLKQTIPGKMQQKCTGPYTFFRFLGKKRGGAELLDSAGRVSEVAVANLLPYHAPVPTEV